MCSDYYWPEGTSSTTWNIGTGDCSNWNTGTDWTTLYYPNQFIPSTPTKEEIKVTEDWVVTDQNGCIVFQHDEEKRCRKWIKKNSTDDTVFYLYRAVSRFGNKSEVVEEAL